MISKRSTNIFGFIFIQGQVTEVYNQTLKANITMKHFKEVTCSSNLVGSKKNRNAGIETLEKKIK